MIENQMVIGIKETVGQCRETANRWWDGLEGLQLKIDQLGKPHYQEDTYEDLKKIREPIR